MSSTAPSGKSTRRKTADRYKAKGMARPLEYDDRNRLFRFAVGRGFEPDFIISEIKTIQKS